MRVIGYAYPWDVLTPGFVDRARDLGVDDIAVAVSYHSTRAATPWRDDRAYVLAPTSALYRSRAAADAAPWPTGMQPRTATWAGSPDPAADAVRVLNDAGIPALAWTVLTHNSVVGEAVPQFTITNCFGQRYPWGMCSAYAETRAFAATVAEVGTAGLDLAGVILESCGPMGLMHQCEHEKTDGVWSPAAIRVLSICCCDACAAGWSTPAETVRRTLRSAAQSVIADGTRTFEDVVPADLAADILSARQGYVDALRSEVVAAVAGRGRLTIHASVDPWVTSPLPGLTPATGADVQSVVLPCWITGDAAVANAEAARASLPDTVATGAYVTAVGPAPNPELPSAIGQFAAAGVSELHLYHLGLAGPARWPDMRAAVAAARHTGS